MADLRRFLPSMATFRKVVMVVGLIAIGLLLWKLDVRLVLRTISRVGFGIFLILGLDVVPITLNALAWKLSFKTAEARAHGIPELWRLWLAMDGVNYLVPTGTIAGEVARASMLKPAHPPEIRNASVVISRFGQTVAQVAFILSGLAWLARRIPWVERHDWVTIAAKSLLVVILVLALLFAFSGHRWIAARQAARQEPEKPRQKLGREVNTYWGQHPWRFLFSICIFAIAYAWLAVEVWLICRFIGVPVTALTALTIEVLSATLDGALFLVPAKIGTQELGKTAIFSILRLPMTSGLAFGIIRHTREIFWALVGFAIYSTWRRRTKETAREAP